MEIDLASALRGNHPMSTATTKDHASNTKRETLAVCIVDDEPSMVEMLQTAAEQMGYRAAGTADPGRPMTGGEPWRPLPLEEVRGLHIQRVPEMCEGNRVRAAQILGIGTSLYRHLKRASKTKTGAPAA